MGSVVAVCGRIACDSSVANGIEIWKESFWLCSFWRRPAVVGCGGTKSKHQRPFRISVIALSITDGKYSWRRRCTLRVQAAGQRGVDLASQACSQTNLMESDLLVFCPGGASQSPTDDAGHR
jgi:hypothetical protein